MGVAFARMVIPASGRFAGQAVGARALAFLLTGGALVDGFLIRSGDVAAGGPPEGSPGTPKRQTRAIPRQRRCPR